MTSWNEFQRSEPAFADAVRQTFAVRKHATMATTDASGAPRISGTEVDFRSDGEVYLGMMPGARRAADLRADPRVAVHCPTVDPPPEDQTRWPGEGKLAAVAVETEPGSHEFRLDLRRVVLTRISDDGAALQITVWEPGVGVRVLLRS